MNSPVVEISPKTREFVRQLNVFSAQKLTRQDDLAILLELALTKNQKKELGEIAFLAKFLSSTYAILKRGGSDAVGHDKLSSEFQTNLDRVTEMLKRIVAETPPTTKEDFSSRFFSLTADGFENLMNLLCDLSWLKNWINDQKPFP
ncbi:MAG: hypothetical protein WBW16_09560 [Bacteroidota bacterium]